MKLEKFLPVLAFALVFALSACGETLALEDREGLKIGERLTLRPYVTLSMTYDSNVGASGSHPEMHKRNDFFWSISPSLWLHYNAETWSVILSGFYRYHDYLKSENKGYSSHNFGEDLRWNWANSTGAEKGWSLILGQSFQQITRSDSLVTDSGSNYGGDSRQFQLSGSVQRRLNQYLHGDVNASYYWLNYDNDNGRGNGQNYSFYGWDRWMVGAEVGFAPSRWTDIILSGSYHGYSQDNAENTSVGGKSSGYSLHAGLGSYMTDRISYRLMGGWSRFKYGDGSDTSDSFVYTATGNWKIGDTWNMMLLASSYYQPSERQRASKSFVNNVSWGLAKTMVRGKLRATLDIRYRRETHEYVIDSDHDYILNIWTGRLGLSYSLCRYLSVYAHGEYQKSMNDEADSRRGAYDYDRFRITAGLRLSY